LPSFSICAKGVGIMSETTPPTDPKPLLFPAFMYGDKTTCRRKLKAEVKKWAQCYMEGREFPEPKLIPIPPGSIVFTAESTSNWVGEGYSMNAANTVVTINTNPKATGIHIQWRAYILYTLQHEAENVAKLSRAECFRFRSVFVPFVCRYPWGAISATAIDWLLNSIELTVPRIAGVLRDWDALDTLKYIDSDERPISLAKFMTDSFRGTVAMWVDQPTGNIRTDLQTAIDQMRHASADEIHARLIKRLRDYVDIDKDLKNREWLKSPGVIEAGLEAERQNGQEWYDDLTGGLAHEHGRFTRLLERNHGPAVE